MNKQQLASKIWESANKMRSKIEANEYKDYILGFIFYNFLSEKEENYLDKISLPKENREEYVKEENIDIRDNIQKNIGYFISYNDLFSTWLNKKSDFDISNVRDALNAFSRNISDGSKKVFDRIFETLQTGLSKLGDSAKAQTKAVSDLIYLIKDIPMDGTQDYDVLGFIYEYLISNFAANAGKKAGEFYTPHEVSLLMSEIIAEHLKDRSDIQIYDPTSGSGSLLINIGKSASKYIKGENKIKYYAQELKQNTYNLTRMNLVMRGILPENIVTRNGDTLAEDWPFFDENHAYNPLFVDAVVSNPPYSQSWDPTDMEVDPRFKEYGIAPKGKADYAFLLHDLYHLKGNGIMTIVLPHGVLFRGGEEREIRKNLVEKNNIDTIIGLPANIFFGTGIPTIIMILKKQKENTDIQIIDASKGFVKEGKNNKLRACDIKKIVDAVINRCDVPKFSRVVSRKEIRENDYNLNIPRYIDSSEEQESYDIYASMFGGIPAIEINKYDDFWKNFPTLKNELLKKINNNYYELYSNEISEIVNNNNDVIAFKENFEKSMERFEEYLNNNLVANPLNVDINNEENILSNQIYKMLENNILIDYYKAYQILDDSWNNISNDIEMIQTEGIDAVKKVDPNMIIKKKNGNEEEVQDGWIGHIIPFELIQKYKLSNELEELNKNNDRLSEITSEYEELFDGINEEEKDSISNDNNDSFDMKKVSEKIKEIKKEKIEVLEDSFEEKIIRVFNLSEEEKKLKKTIKSQNENIILLSKISIENLSDNEVIDILKLKWVKSLVNNLNELPKEIINNFIKNIKKISNKYETTLVNLEDEIKNVENELAGMIDELTGDEFDMKGLSELKALLSGE